MKEKQKTISRVTRNSLAMNALKEYQELMLADEFYDELIVGAEDYLVAILTKKFKEAIYDSGVFDEFDNQMGKNLDEFVDKYNEDLIGDGFSCFSLNDYLELKSKYGLTKLEILNNDSRFNLGLTSNEIKFLVYIFKKMILLDEKMKGGYSYEANGCI